MIDADTQRKLEQIPADHRLIDILYEHEKISKEARESALNFLYPDNQWGKWISRWLLAVGTVLMLSGIVYFFAFNWTKINSTLKLFSIEIGIVTCLIEMYRHPLQHFTNQILLLSASVLVGAFIAVFSQIYQTEGYTYQIFMTWALLIVGWTWISNFATQWIGWLLITNIFIYLWWKQAFFHSKEMQDMIFPYMALLNSCALALREYFKGYTWLTASWIRPTLLIPTLLIMLIPVAIWINTPIIPTISILLGLAVSLMGHGLSYYLYRYKLRDIRAYSITMVSICILIAGLTFRVLEQIFQNQGTFFSFLLMGMITICIFTYGIIHLRKVAKAMESNYE